LFSDWHKKAKSPPGSKSYGCFPGIAGIIGNVLKFHETITSTSPDDSGTSSALQQINSRPDILIDVPAYCTVSAQINS